MIFQSLVRIKARPRKTAEDFMKLPEGTLAELIDGEIFMSPAPKRPHQSTVGKLFNRLTEFVDSRGLGEVYIAPFDVHLPTGDIVQPDILFVSQARLNIVKDWVFGSPDLMVEVLSPDGAPRDRMIKRGLYARNGVQEYWIVDPVEKTIEVFSLGGEHFEPCGFFTESDMFESPMMREFTFPLSELFTRVI